MTSPASDSLKEIIDRLDARIQRVDEERWLSSRYANSAGRDALIVLYAFYYELARVRLAVTDPTLGQIRFQWWRDALAGIDAGEVREHDLVLALADQVQPGRLNSHALIELIDLHETAFLENNRDLEPEADLAILAGEVIAPEQEVTDLIRSIAPDWARLRRGEEAQQSLVGARVSSALRPALGHYRLRWSWRKGHQPSPSGRRLSILLAIMTGKI
ncbi:MAG: squalene/phytoene synthase family protein [Pseudomonadota bacterium]